MSLIETLDQMRQQARTTAEYTAISKCMDAVQDATGGELISRQAAIDALGYGNEWEVLGITVIDKDDAERQIMALPSAQPEIIRCKDCKHGDWYKNAKEEWRCYCLKTEAYNMGEDDFCSRAERRTDGSDR